MKRNKTMGLLALAMAALMLTQCKKEENNIPSVSTPTAKESATKEGIAAAKVWLAQQQAALAKSGGAIQLADAEKINWHNPISGTDGHTLFVPVNIDDQQMAKYLKITKGADGAITNGNYVYLYSTMNKQPDAYLLEGKKIPTEFSGTILEYALNNQLLASKVYEKGNVVAGKTAKLALKPTSSKGNAATNSNAQAKVVCYEYYMQTFVNGLLVTEVYLYTMCYGTPDATLESEGGGGVDESAALMAQFNEYVKSASLSEESTTAPATTPDPEPHSYTHTWVVAESTMPGAWKVTANTRMDWYHDKYYNMLTNAIEHKFDIVFFKTLNTSLVTNNPLVNTTWSPAPSVDNIYDNGTANAHGRANVTGNLKHVSVFKVINPLDPFGPWIPLVRDYGIDRDFRLYAN